MEKLKLAEIMSRATFLRFDGKVVLKYDLSNLVHKEDITKVINYFKGLIGRMPEKSTYCLLDITGVSADVVSAEEMSRDIEQHSSSFLAAAVVANDPKSCQLIKAVRTHLKVYLPIYEEEQAAIDWLLSVNAEDTLPGNR
jgi:hypothetical protein